MKQWMKQLSRILVLTLAVVCLIGCISMTAHAGWVEDSTGYWYQNSDGSYPSGGWRYVSAYSGWYYFNSSGYLQTKWGSATENGWLDVGGKWYHVDSNSSTSWDNGYGRMQTGWQKIGSVYYYFSESGSDPTKSDYGKMLTGWQTIGGKKYYLGGAGDGVMRVGWQKIDGYDYYFNSSGHMVSNAWQGEYWLGSDGKMVTSAWVDNENYYVDANGKYVTGWLNYNNYWYFLNDGTVSGYEKGQLIEPSSAGWIKIGNYYYYFYPAGQIDTGSDAAGWLYLGSETYMLNTTAADPKSGKYSRMHEWVQVGDWYYFDKSTGKMKTSSWVPSANGANDSNAYVDEDGKMVIGWKEIPSDSGIWYYFNGSGKKQTNQIITDSIQGWKTYYVDSNGIMVKDTQITVSGTTYYADASGVLFPLNKKLNALNPYFDYVIGGLYGTSTNPIENRTRLTNVTKTSAGYAIVQNQPIDLAYTEISIGAYPAKDGDLSVHIPSALRPMPEDYAEWDTEGMDWVWDDAIDGAMAEAITTNKSAIINSGGGDTEFIYAWYKNIATLNNRSVSLRMSVVDYGVVVGLGSPLISFNKVNGQPGIITAGIPWIQVKYELFYEDTHELIPATTKGNTSFYDVDNRQSICFSDNTNRGIYCSSSCNLKFGTVTQNGILNGDCIFYDLDNSLNESDANKPLYGFTEIFQGNTLIRTFSFENKGRFDPKMSSIDYPDGAASGAIYNYGDPISSGKLKISKTVNPNTDTTEFTFKIKLTGATEGITIPSSMFFGAEGGVYSSVAFTNGEATVKLKHGQSVTIVGIPSSLKYTVTETASNAYQSTSSGASGTIAANATKEAKFTNTRLQTLAVKKIVDTDFDMPDTAFSITLTYKKPGDANATTVPLALKNGETSTPITLPYGTTYTVTENPVPSGYSVAYKDDLKGTLTQNNVVEVTNTQEERTLTVDKVVAGTGTAKDKEFTLILNVWYADGTKYITDREIKLKDSTDPVSITLPKNAKYIITETEESKAGFLVSGEVTSATELTDNANVTITNTELLDLTVKKEVKGVTKESDKAFNFAVVYKTPGSEETVTEKFTLTDAESKIIENLPYGTVYTVTEEPDDGYTTEGTVDQETSLTQDTTVTVTNTAIEHKLTVGKTVIGDADAQKQDFTFTLRWKRADADVYTEQSFTLKHGQAQEFILPTGCTYEVTETQTDGYLAPVASENASVTGMTKDETVEFTNTQLVTLTLQKQVAGNMGNKTQEFAFTVKLGTGVEANAVTGTATYNDGVYTVNLAHDQSVVFTLPYNTAYEITENDYSEEGYETEISGADSTNGYIATGEANGESVLYKNSKGFAIPTGVGMAVLPFLGMILIGAVVGIGQILGGSRKSRRGRYLN